MKFFVSVLGLLFFYNVSIWSQNSINTKKNENSSSLSAKDKEKKTANPWKLREGILAPIYQNASSHLGKQATLRLRLQVFDEKKRELVFYDDKGNPLVINVEILFYNHKLLQDFRKLIPGVFYHIRFEITGFDYRKRLSGKFVSIERDILRQL